MALRLALTAIFSFTFSFSAHAGVSQAERGLLEKVVAANNRSKSAAEFVSNAKDLLHPKHAEFFSKKASEAGSVPLPKMKISGGDTLVTSDKRASVTFKIVDAKAGKFSLNGKALDFSQMKTLEEMFTAMEKAMPDIGGENAWFNLFIPRAHANPALVIYFIAASVAGVVVYDLATCGELHDEIDKCYGQKSAIINYLAKMNSKIATAKAVAESKGKPQKAAAKKKKDKKKGEEEEEEDEDEELKNFTELKALRAKGQCLPYAVSTTIDDSIFEVFSSIRKMVQHPASELVLCHTGKKFPSEIRMAQSRAPAVCGEKSMFSHADSLLYIKQCRHTWTYWPDIGASDRSELLKKCAKSLYEMSKDLCLKRGPDLYELHNPEEMQRPPSATTR